jgi:glycosyltransferase involved in cell wall biosynthesis
MTTKNGGAFLGASVASVLAQSFTDFELVIVSDGSTDNTADVARALAAKDSLSRIHVIELKNNVGPGLARDMAIRQAAGNYIALLDDDDVWSSREKLQRQKDYLDTNPDVVLVGASRVEFVRLRDADGPGAKPVHDFWLTQEKDPERIRNNMLAYNPVITSSVMFRKDAYLQSGGFKAMYLAEDYDLWLRMGLIGNIANIDGAETAYTVRDKGAARSRQIEMAHVVIRLVKEYKGKYPNFPKAIIKGYLRLLILFVKKIF